MHRFSKTTTVLNMKYPAFLAIFFILTVSSASGQLTLGARGGFGISSTSFATINGIEREIGTSPIAGLIFHYNFDQKFSVGFEVNYNRFSENIIYSLDTTGRPISAGTTKIVNTKTKTDISYFQIPITGRASIGDKKIRGILELGIYGGIGINGSWTNGPNVKFYNASNNVPSKVELTGNYTLNQGKIRKWDVGGILGGGVEYKLNNTSLLFAVLRIQFGLVDIYNLNPTERSAYYVTGFDPPSASWQAANFSLGYLKTFKLPKFGSDGNKRAGKQKKSS